MLISHLLSDTRQYGTHETSFAIVDLFFYTWLFQAACGCWGVEPKANPPEGAPNAGVELVDAPNTLLPPFGNAPN